MARPGKWHSKTVAIRVPEHLAEKLLDHARLLDTSFVQNSDAPEQSLMVTLDSGTPKEQRRIISATSKEWDEADRLVDELLAQFTAAGLKPKQLPAATFQLLEKFIFKGKAS